MNLRIRELVKQAGDYVNEVYTPPVRSKTPGKIWEDGHVEWNTLFQKKFAELIVRECASICDQQGRASWNDDRKAQARLDRDLIKEHFGVEE